MKKSIDKLGAYAYKIGKDFSIVFEEMLDFFIETFDIDRVMRHKCNFPVLLAERKQDNPDMFELLVRWLELATQGINKNGAYDFFGTMYEEVVKGKFKSSAMGQFFTPLALCGLMAEVTYSPEGRTVCDCACGSGRTLLAHFSQSDKTKLYYYYGGDLDPVCVKMCTLNFMIHGMFGIVERRNALTREFFNGYIVNELCYPIPLPCPSIRKADEDECRKNLEYARGIIPKKTDTAPPKPQPLNFFNF